MIQHIRVRRVAIPAGLLDDLISDALRDTGSPMPAEQADETLDVLMRHAVRTNGKDHDTEHIWGKLARKMRGPFGAPALEGPAFSQLEVELESSGGLSLPVPFVLHCRPSSRGSHDLPGHEALWSLLRFDHLGLPQRGCNSLLA